jgi:hypothetical protein
MRLHCGGDTKLSNKSGCAAVVPQEKRFSVVLELATPSFRSPALSAGNGGRLTDAPPQSTDSSHSHESPPVHSPQSTVSTLHSPHSNICRLLLAVPANICTVTSTSTSTSTGTGTTGTWSQVMMIANVD